jgi:hypothetical protein
VRWIIIGWFTVVVGCTWDDEAGLPWFAEVAEDAERVKVLICGIRFFGVNDYLVFV